MRAIFQSKFPDLDRLFYLAVENVSMIKSGEDYYLGFLPLMKKISEIKNNYISVYDLYEKLQIEPFVPLSKRNLYKKYNSGIVVGAGSGHDCIGLIENDKWILYDLFDKRMTNKAIGYCDSEIVFNKTGTHDGDTITNVSDKYVKGRERINVVKIDSEINDKIEIISLDVEGSALDVLSGSLQTIIKYKPDLLVSIYHNYIEYLLTIPFIYDLGYNIDVVVTPNFSPQNPHLELSLYCKFSGDKQC